MAFEFVEGTRNFAFYAATDRPSATSRDVHSFSFSSFARAENPQMTEDPRGVGDLEAVEGDSQGYTLYPRQAYVAQANERNHSKYR